MSEKYWTAADLIAHGYRFEAPSGSPGSFKSSSELAEEKVTYCITGEDDPLSQRVRKRSRDYALKMAIRVVCIICAVLVDGWMRWAFVAGSAILPWAAVVIANGEPKNRNSGFSPYLHEEPQKTLTGSSHSSSDSFDHPDVIDLEAHHATNGQ